VNDYFRRWDYDGTLGRIRHALYIRCREQAEREASPTVAIIDSQSVEPAMPAHSGDPERPCDCSPPSANMVLTWSMGGSIHGVG
jgi:hypothetical protein